MKNSIIILVLYILSNCAFADLIKTDEEVIDEFGLYDTSRKLYYQSGEITDLRGDQLTIGSGVQLRGDWNGFGNINGSVGIFGSNTVTDLRNADIRDSGVAFGMTINIEYIDLEGADATGIIFQESTISNINFAKADLRRANFKNSTLTNVSFDQADLSDANLEGIKSSGIKGTPILPEGYVVSSIDSRNGQSQKGSIIGPGVDLSFLDGPGEDSTYILRAKMIDAIKKGAVLSGIILPKGWSRNDIDNLIQMVQLEELQQIRQNTSKITSDTSIEHLNLLKQISKELNILNAKINNLQAVVDRRDEQIAELEQRPTLDEVRDARAGSVVLSVDPEGEDITLGITIEQSDNLLDWTKLKGELSRTIPIPDGKKFYRFALDK